jgi:cyclopropane fatty-acyl-phospholipid synthase-like methyltransferase
MQRSFEQVYLELRAYEHRIYTDDVVKQLPFLKDEQLLKIPLIKKEWKVRRRSAAKLIRHLSRRNPKSILEIGCGNGWLAHRMAASFPATTIVATDINQMELSQGHRVFSGFHDNLTFQLVDIFKGPIDTQFDCIIAAGSIQYFADVRKTINTLLDLLLPNGEIHLVDSPFYTLAEIRAAKVRSESYFDQCGCPEMKNYYHHHLWKELEDFHFQVRYDPLLTWNRLGQKIRNDSPFPWIVIS